MSPISLHQLTVLDAAPPQVVDIAAACGCQHVCLFVFAQPETRKIFPLVETPQMLALVRARAQETGVSVYNIEYFPIEPATDVLAYAPALEMGAALGAKRATAIIYDKDLARAGDTLAAFCDLAAQFEFQVGVEFVSYIGGLNTLPAAASFIRQVAKPNLAITLDTLHLVRSGGSASCIQGADAELIRHVQICDGPAQMDIAARPHEGRSERQIPGEGAFPLNEIVAALPRDLIFDVECPMQSLQAAGVGPLERARRAVQGARNVLARRPDGG